MYSLDDILFIPQFARLTAEADSETNQNHDNKSSKTRSNSNNKCRTNATGTVIEVRRYISRGIATAVEKHKTYPSTANDETI